MTELRAVMVDDNAVSSPIFQIRKDVVVVADQQNGEGLRVTFGVN
jgi:hypothetical protein